MVGNKNGTKKKSKARKKSSGGNLNYKKSLPKTNSIFDEAARDEETISLSSSAGTDYLSLSASIFGDPSSSSENNGLGGLFASADKFQQSSKDRVKKNLDSMEMKLSNDLANASSEQTVQMSLLSREQIINARESRCESEEAIALTESVSVQIPDISVLEGFKDHTEKSEVRRGMMNMLTIQSDSIMRENGVVILESMDRMISKDTMDSLSTQAAVIETQICQRLKEEKIMFHVQAGQSQDIHSCTSAENREKEINNSFQYHEVASRCLGRLDIRYKMDQEPFSKEQVISNEFIIPVVQSLLGNDAKLVYAGLILSFPNSADQPWHQDGTSLFDDKEFPVESTHLPPYALNVFVPLDEVTAEVGPTEFCVGSHMRKRAQEVTKYLDKGDEKSAKVIGPLLKTGDALIYDYRVCHRGTQNLSKDKTRPMLYLMYARPWFREHINFGKTRLF